MLKRRRTAGFTPILRSAKPTIVLVRVFVAVRGRSPTPAAQSRTRSNGVSKARSLDYILPSHVICVSRAVNLSSLLARF
jgi:hypothetical protein